MESTNVKNSFLKTVRSFKSFLLVIFGVLLLVSLLITLVPKTFYSKVFTENIIADSLLGAVLGSISTGNPLVSYMIGGELLDEGVSLMAITAFILAWISVGVVQLPAEIEALGKRFAIARNSLSFLTVLVVAILTVFTVSFL